MIKTHRNRIGTEGINSKAHVLNSMCYPTHMKLWTEERLNKYESWLLLSLLISLYITQNEATYSTKYSHHGTHSTWDIAAKVLLQQCRPPSPEVQGTLFRLQ